MIYFMNKDDDTIYEGRWYDNEPFVYWRLVDSVRANGHELNHCLQLLRAESNGQKTRIFVDHEARTIAANWGLK